MTPPPPRAKGREKARKKEKVERIIGSLDTRVEKYELPYLSAILELLYRTVPIFNLHIQPIANVRILLLRK